MQIVMLQTWISTKRGEQTSHTNVLTFVFPFLFLDYDVPWDVRFSFKITRKNDIRMLLGTSNSLSIHFAILFPSSCAKWKMNYTWPLECHQRLGNKNLHVMS